MLLRLILKSGLLAVIAFSEPVTFRFDEAPIKNIVYSSSFWLSSSAAIDPSRENRFSFQAGYCTIFNQQNNDYWSYPNVDMGLKITKNLSITTKAYGFYIQEEAPQVLGAGIQYYFGTNNDTLNWSTCIQRVDLKGLEHFRISSITFDIRKWISLKSTRFRIGAGSNFFKENSYLMGDNIPTKIEGQINFLGLDITVPLSIFILGIEARMNSDMVLTTIFLQKEIF